MQKMSAAAQNRLGLNLPLNPAAILATSGGARSAAPYRRHTASAGDRMSPTKTEAAKECKSSSVDHGLMKIATGSSSVQRQGIAGSGDPDTGHDGFVPTLKTNTTHENSKCNDSHSANVQKSGEKISLFISLPLSRSMAMLRDQTRIL
jgi:hypothetical protein